MITQRFSYEAPTSAAEAAEIVGRAPDVTTVLGGGTWVVPELSQRRRRADVLVDLRQAGMDRVEQHGDRVVIGAATTYADVVGSQAAPAVLRELARGITGGAQIRNQGTLGGSACYANPASDVPGALVALDATMVIRTHTGGREVAASEFFLGAFSTCLAPDELLESILIDSDLAGRTATHIKFKVAEGSWPIVTATCVTAADGSVDNVVIGGAAHVPFRVPVNDLADLAHDVVDAIPEPWEDVLASGPFRRHVAGVLAGRVVATTLNKMDGATDGATNA